MPGVTVISTVWDQSINVAVTLMAVPVLSRGELPIAVLVGTVNYGPHSHGSEKDAGETTVTS